MTEKLSKNIDKNISNRRALELIIFCLSLVIPSTGTVHKYFGYPGLILYIIVVFLAVFLGYRFVLEKFLLGVTEKQAFGLMLLTLLGLLVAFAIVYPVANSGLMGSGSDRDEALNIAATELVHLRYPYYNKTYLGGPISPLPGAIILAIPFVLLGNSAYQNFFWLMAFFLTIKSYLKDGRLTLILIWYILGLSPEILREFITGGDGLGNSIYILIFILLLIRLISQSNKSKFLKIIFAILLGIGLSSRPHLILLVPLVFSLLIQNNGWRIAAKYMLLTCTVLGAVTLPFYLYDSQAFSPLHQTTKLSQFSSILPFAEIIIPLLGGTIACCLAFQRMDKKGILLMRNCAIIQAFMVLSPFVLSSISSRELSFNFIGYGIYFLFFGTVYSLSSIVETEQIHEID
jgi:hypothetical protein